MHIQGINRRLSRAVNRQRSKIRDPLNCYAQDLAHIFRYGFDSPRKYQQLYVDPLDIVEKCDGFKDTTGLDPYGAATPTVIGGEWDRLTRALDSIEHIRMVKRRIRERVEWEETAEFRSAVQSIVENGSYRNRFFNVAQLIENYT